MSAADEVRVTDPQTGGQKGQKQAQLGAIHPLALLELAKVAGYGTEKYERYNFLRGYRWSLSFDALQRHLLAFWGGEDTDGESKLHHLAHGAWHCLTLLTFSLLGLGTDDRPQTEKHMRAVLPCCVSSPHKFPYVCNLPSGHSGEHKAYVGGELVRRWEAKD